VHSDHPAPLRGAGFALSTQSDTQAVVRLFRNPVSVRSLAETPRLRPPRCRRLLAPCPGYIALLDLWDRFRQLYGIRRGRQRERLWRRNVTPSSECADANRGLRRRHGETRPQRHPDCELSFGQPNSKCISAEGSIVRAAGARAQRRRIDLLHNKCVPGAMRPGVRGVEIYRRAQLLSAAARSCRSYCRASHSGVGPVRLEPSRPLRTLQRLVWVALILQRERQM